MELVNRQFAYGSEPRPVPAVLVVPLGRTYAARLVHATFRCRNQPSETARETHVHDVYHVILVTGGRGHFVVGDRLQPAEPGLVVLTGPGEPHSFFCAPGEDTEFCEVTFELVDPRGEPLRRPFHEMLGAWTGTPCRAVGCAHAEAALHLAIMREVERIVRIGFAQERDAALLINDGLGRILLALYTDLVRDAPSGGEDRLRRVRDHIHEHYDRPLGLARLARIAGVTPNHLSRRFKQRFGTTPLFYQHRLRIRTAADLLRTTDHPIQRIAALTGYGDAHFFSRMFKRWQGAAPACFRRAARRT